MKNWLFCEVIQFAITFCQYVIVPILVAITINAIIDRAHAADYGYYGGFDNPSPPVVVQPPPVVVVPSEPQCRHERIITHDDILDSNDWVDREVCE